MGWDWDMRDYIAAAVLIGGGLGAYAVLARSVRRPRHRVWIGLGCVAAVALVWAQLAVGLV